MHFGKSHLEDKREDLRSHYGKIEKTAGVTALYLKSFGEGGFGPVALSVTAAFPLVAAILTLLARRGIVKDDKLVRSLDRIR